MLLFSVIPAIAEEQRPNIVLIHADDLGPEHVGCYGGKVLTPHIDSLADQGAMLDRYYACSAVCSPSRYNLLTGRYASRCVDLVKQFPNLSEPAFIRWNAFLRGEEKTIGHLFRNSGYATGFIGKHHNTDNESRTFQEELPDGADPQSKDEKARMQRNYQRLVDEVQKATGFEEVGRLFANNLHTLDIDPILQEHNPEWVTEGAVEFIETHRDESFFLYIGLTLPHGPSPIQSMRSDPKITPKGFLEQAPESQPSREDVFERVEKAGLPEHVAHLTWLDDSVGAILNKLEKEGLEQNTIVIFVSDHSTRGKLTCYDDGSRTPALIRWPGKIPAGKKLDALMGNIDIAPLVINAAGVEVPSDYHLDGINSMPLLTGKTDSIRDSLLLEIVYTKGIVTRDWKYIATRFPSHIRKKITPENRNQFNHEGQQSTKDAIAGVVSVRYGTDKRHPGLFSNDQLYYLPTDPGEGTNITYESDRAVELKRMQQILKSYTESFPHRFGKY